MLCRLTTAPCNFQMVAGGILDRDFTVANCFDGLAKHEKLADVQDVDRLKKQIITLLRLGMNPEKKRRVKVG